MRRNFLKPTGWELVARQSARALEKLPDIITRPMKTLAEALKQSVEDAANMS